MSPCRMVQVRGLYHGPVGRGRVRSGLARVREILGAKAQDSVNALIAKDKSLENEMKAIESVERLARYYRDLHRVLTNFVNFRDAGDPVELGKMYSDQGADELVYLDITASHEGRKTFTDIVKNVAAEVSIPFTVGGGINELKDVDRLLNAGADKVSINSSALRNPDLIGEIAKNFGTQVCVVAIDANFEVDGSWRCYLNGGRVPTDRELFTWAKEAESRGAGEILFTSMTHDGVKEGYANDALRRLAEELHIPIIASGGAGKRARAHRAGFA